MLYIKKLLLIFFLIMTLAVSQTASAQTQFYKSTILYNATDLTGAACQLWGTPFAKMTSSPYTNYMCLAGTWTPIGTSSSALSSVGLTSPSGLFTFAGSPVTTSGDISFDFASQPANLVLASQASSGISALPTFRPLVSDDIPLLTASKISNFNSAVDNRIFYPVPSVFGRTGAILAQANDYTFAQLASKPTTFSGYGISDTSINLATSITNETGSGNLVFGTSPTIVTPTIASFTNATHNHQSAAGGGSLDAAATGSGIFNSARLGSGTANNSVFLRGDGTWASRLTGNLTLAGTTDASGTTDSTGALSICHAGGTICYNFARNTTNGHFDFRGTQSGFVAWDFYDAGINLINGNISMQTAGNRFFIKEGANAGMGIATLSSGSVVVNNTLITANTRISLTLQDCSANIGTPYVSTRSVGSSFTISNTNILNTCSVFWVLYEPY